MLLEADAIADLSRERATATRACLPYMHLVSSNDRDRQRPLDAGIDGVHQP